MADIVRTKVRYPVHAVLLVAAAGLLLALNMLVGFLFMALVPPLIPVYATILFAGGCLVRTAMDYAVRVSRRGPAAMLQAGKHGEEVRHGNVAAARAA